MYIYLSTYQKKISRKLNYWEEDKTITNCGITTGKELLASKAHSVLTKMKKILKSTGGSFNMWSWYQNISGLSFTNPELPALKYGQIMEMKAINEFFDLMKNKHENLVISECDLFSDKTNCFTVASSDRLMTCDCCEDACV